MRPQSAVQWKHGQLFQIRIFKQVKNILVKRVCNSERYLFGFLQSIPAPYNPIMKLFIGVSLSPE